MKQRRHLLCPALDKGIAWASPMGKDTFRRWWLKVTTTSTLVLCWKDWKSLSRAPQVEYSNTVACEEQISQAQLTGFHLPAPVSCLSSTTNYSTDLSTVGFSLSKNIKTVKEKSHLLKKKNALYTNTLGDKRAFITSSNTQLDVPCQFWRIAWIYCHYHGSTTSNIQHRHLPQVLAQSHPHPLSLAPSSPPCIFPVLSGFPP